MMKYWDIDSLFTEVKYRDAGTIDGVQMVYFENEPYLGKTTDVFAYLGIPRDVSGPVPGIVCVHGGGGMAFKEWVEMWVARGYAAIALDLRGQGEGGQRHDHAGPDLDHARIFDTECDWKDLWTYHAVAAVIRSHTLLRGMPGVGQTAITGISWGGYLTCITAALDNRFSCAMPVYGCGFLEINSAEEWMKYFAAMTPDQRQNWHDKCDPSVYLPDITSPILFVSGTNDYHYPLDILQKSYSLPQTPVTTSVQVGMEHSHPAGWAALELSIYADSHLKGGEPLIFLGKSVLEGNQIGAEFHGLRPVKSATLNFTTDTCPWQCRQWHVIPASMSGSQIGGIVPEDSTACFLSIKDDRSALVSSSYIDLCADSLSSIRG